MSRLRWLLSILAARESSLDEQAKRVRLAVLSSGGQAFAKAAQIAVTLALVPVLISYFGSEEYGLLMAIVGFASWFLADTGLAEGVKVKLIESFAQREPEEARAYVSTGLVALLAVAAAAGIGLAVALVQVDWSVVFNTNVPDAELAVSVAIVGFVAVLIIPLRIQREVYTADQRGYVYFLWTSVGTVLSLVGAWAAVNAGRGMPAVLAGMQVPVLTVSALGFLFLFSVYRTSLRPSISDVRYSTWKRMWPGSLGLFAMGVGLLVINGTDIFIANLILGGSQAAEYALSLRLFLYVQVVVSLVTYPAWPAIGEAYRRGEVRWVDRASRLLLWGSLSFTAAASVILVVAGPRFIDWWSRGEVQSSRSLLVLLGLYVIARVWSVVYATLLRSRSRVIGQGLITLVEAALHLILGISLARMYGLHGLAVGAIVSIAVTRVWVLPFEYYVIQRRESTVG